jgi:hypothetical protein
MPRPLFTPGEKPATYCTGGWVGRRAGLDKWEKSRPHRDSVPGPSSPIPDICGPKTMLINLMSLFSKLSINAGNFLTSCKVYR